MECRLCGCEYDQNERIDRPGKMIHCEACAEEYGDAERYTGNMIWSAKTNGSIQINSSRYLTDHINNSTKLRNKGSNLGSNLIASSKFNKNSKPACVVVADTIVYKVK